MVKVFKWHLLPDTMYFWLDYLMKLWDEWSEKRFAFFDCRYFRRSGICETEPIVSQPLYPF
jgi:hypothetical protein